MIRNRRVVARVSPVLAASSLTVCSGACALNARMIARPRSTDWMNSRGRPATGASSSSGGSDAESVRRELLDPLLKTARAIEADLAGVA